MGPPGGVEPPRPPNPAQAAPPFLHSDASFGDRLFDLVDNTLIPTRQQMILSKALTEVKRVKKCVDRAVDDIFFLLYNG